jgi:hypothetical protein
LRARVITLFGSDHDIAKALPGFLCQSQADSAEASIGPMLLRDEIEQYRRSSQKSKGQPFTTAGLLIFQLTL